ncbi:JAB domain-containing protein [Novosphingobium sp. PC22D]|uniref:JAB domain-containing protein n=1 Tax=Novosphingobium sp. PC22D TaxID=1962403 RepID=UPI0023E78DED|nr:JAB domain-containing protein [Novosphingobium sp. PC22D]
MLGPMTTEILVQICYDGQGRCCGTQVLFNVLGGAFAGCHRALVERGFATRARGYLLVHNHPSGRALPSSQDIGATRAIVAVSGAVGFEVGDHLIVAGRDAVSMRRLGALRARPRHTGDK